MIPASCRISLTSLLLAALWFSPGASAEGILPGSELNGGWFNTEAPGQGLLVDINPEINLLFAGWFTYKNHSASSEDPENHRWYTLQGTLQGSNNEFSVYLTGGGQFNDPAVTQTNPVGVANLVFTDCNNAVLTFDLDDGSADTINMARLLPVDEARCAQLADPALQSFSIDAIRQQHDAVAQEWIPFLDTSSIDAGVYYLEADVNDNQGLHGEDEVYIIIRGSAQLQAGSQSFAAAPGKIFFVKTGVSHRFVNITEDLEVLVLFSSAASSSEDPDALAFDLPTIHSNQPSGTNNWNRFLEVASLHLGSYSLPQSAGGDQALFHEVDELNYITHGSASFHVGSESMRVSPGSIVWVREGIPHYFDEISEDLKVLILFHQKPGIQTP